ncbi:CIR protein [Plasmodium chabaudi chabaudi]|uniref:CIR protein n=1 Tax=Plasmodium chabaudi chabaudi TaxID=31271 RepID=A0A4V0K398_PLACU|nr:CIR protein [Plasmodium chabaudi chabaudi]VTZ67325.1 CIR protein [Plasmodium chabaudi chabaudi]|eukprot:XP_016653351.1 CIR protein [Plasmodium chabaudi chabaudi]
MDKNVCKLFIDVDKLFTKGSVNETLFNDSYKNFCPKGGCNTNYDRIGALCEYLLEELSKNDDKQKGDNNNVNQNYEYVFMWLAAKFLNITHDVSFSLNDYYEKFIVNQGGHFNCWGKLDNKEYLKDSNLSIMSVFYQLFMNICKAVVENEISKLETKKFMMIDYNYYQIYDLINSQFSSCDPYVQLLINLKKLYDEYRNLAIKQIPKDQHDTVNSLTCPEINNNDNQPNLQFQSNGCKELHDFFRQISRKRKPKRPSKGSKSSSNYSKTKKNETKSNKGELKKTTSDAEKNERSQKNTDQSTIKENPPSEPKVPESKAPDIPQNGNAQTQTSSKSPEKIQEGSPNHNPVSSDAKDTPKDMGSISENSVNQSTTPKNISKGDISLSKKPQAQQQNVPLPQFPEPIDKKIQLKPENKAVDSNDKFPGTGINQEKSIKQENLPNSTSQHQEENPKTKNTDSPSAQPTDMQKSMDENQKPSDSLSLENSEIESSIFETIIDYSVEIFKIYSSLFNSTVNIIEDYIQDIVLSKISDIVDKITRYQQIIQTINFPKNQIQAVNDQQKEKVEQPTKSTEGTQVSSDGMSSKLVNEPGNYIMGLNGNISKLLSFNFEGYKVAIMGLMAVSIPIVLIIMYKYLYYGCGKTSKKKKIVKKIINSNNEKRRTKKVISPIDGKRTLKTVINPNDRKNTATTVINLIGGKNIMIQSIKSSFHQAISLNAYKHIFSNSAPFINLFFLLIFFVYKGKYISL